MAAPAIAVLNVGSSSVKVALFDAGGDLATPLLAAQRAVDRAGGGDMSARLDEALGLLASTGRPVAAVGHRIVHGGVAFGAPQRVTEENLQAMAALASLAPLHQPQGIEGIRAAQRAWPGALQVACFDTAFHRDAPELNQRYALPQALHDAGLRRYGFHGLSYEWIASQLRERGQARGRIVVAHLGNGGSMCALLDGQPVATTMGFSTLDGLTMGTRCGRLDPAAVLHLWQRHGMDAQAIATLLHRQSGLLGLSGLSADMRELLAAEGTHRGAALAIGHFVEQALRELAGMAAALRGLDALVFTGGIGENAAAVRERIVRGAAWLGPGLDDSANAAGAELISLPGSAVAVRVLRTHEEAVIARHAARLARSAGLSRSRTAWDVGGLLDSR